MLQMICISNTTNVEFHSNGKALYDDRTPVTFDWLIPGTIYDVENMIGKVFIDIETNELIDAVILKDFRGNGGPSKQGWLPANLFIRLEEWREQQLNKIMTKQIKIGDSEYVIQYTPEVADAILNEIIKWMEHPDHYAASCWEGIAQNDNTLIDAPDLIGKIVDKYLQPKCVDED